MQTTANADMLLALCTLQSATEEKKNSGAKMYQKPFHICSLLNHRGVTAANLPSLSFRLWLHNH